MAKRRRWEFCMPLWEFYSHFDRQVIHMLLASTFHVSDAGVNPNPGLCPIFLSSNPVNH